MRWLPLLILVPLVAAHPAHTEGEALQHITLETVSIAPGDSVSYDLDFQGQPFTAGWHWLLRADVSGQAVVTAVAGSQVMAQWDWSDGEHVGVATLPANSTIGLQIINPGDVEATVSFYYDQTCNCLFKMVPMQSGPVWLNIPAEAGQEVECELTFFTQPLAGGDEPTSIDVTIQHVAMGADGPEVMEQWQETYAVGADPCHPGAKWSACKVVTFSAQESGDQLLWIDIGHDGGAWGIGVRPLAQTRDVEDAPGLAFPLLLAGLLLAYRRAM